jgi:hypothetical protein
VNVGRKKDRERFFILRLTEDKVLLQKGIKTGNVYTRQKMPIKSDLIEQVCERYVYIGMLYVKQLVPQGSYI